MEAERACDLAAQFQAALFQTVMYIQQDYIKQQVGVE